MLSSIFSKLKDISYEASYCFLEAKSQYLEFQKQQQNFPASRHASTAFAKT
jgi:hypothetical protein